MNTQPLSNGIDRIAQVKLPVTDLARSVDWYRDLFGLSVWVEITENGRVRGAGLIAPDGAFNISLREREVCAGKPSLQGFDVVAFLPRSREILDDVVARCDSLGIAHNGIQATPGGELVDIADPDGTVLRFYHFTAPTSGFTGVEFRDGDFAGFYQAPRLSPATADTA